jgi:enoyl-CoA hydratase/carnithine racemase
MTQDQQVVDLLALNARGSDGILRLTLSDPARRNALSESMLAALGAAFEAASANHGCARSHSSRGGTGFLCGS